MITHSETKWTAADGTPMHAVRWLPDSEPKMVVCLIHGLGEHSSRYSAMAEHYASFGVEVISFDLRGHGKSGGQRGHSKDFEQLVSDIDRFLKHASNIDFNKPHFLYGHSLGGTLAINYALSHPHAFKGVILSAPMFKPAFVPPKWKVTLARCLQRFWPTLSLSNEVDVKALSTDQVVLRQRAEDPLVHDRISSRFATQLLQEGERLMQEIKKVDFPLLIMHGDADRLTCHKASSSFAEKSAEKASLKIWPGSFHELHHEPIKEELFHFSMDWMKQQL